MISLKEIIKNLKFSELPKDHQDNIMTLLERVNKIRSLYGKPMKVTSGYRSKEDQIRIYKEKASKKQHPFLDGKYDESKVPMKSMHLRGAAIDVFDPDKKLQEWCLSNESILEKVGIWCEDFKYTKNWVHMQIFAPKSGKRFFIP